MNVVATRVVIAVLGAVSIISGVWLFGLLRGAEPGERGSAAVAVCGIVAIILLLAVAIFSIRHGDVVIARDSVTLRYVLAPSRVLSWEEIDSAVLLRSLLLPTRSATANAPRLTLRLNTGGTVSISPRDASVGVQLERHGIDVVTITDPVSPTRARKLVPGSTTMIEELVWPVFIGITIVLPLAVVAWLFVR